MQTAKELHFALTAGKGVTQDERLAVPLKRHFDTNQVFVGSL
jgi:hypothetical protein